jgi:hypothetical protein
MTNPKKVPSNTVVERVGYNGERHRTNTVVHRDNLRYMVPPDFDAKTSVANDDHWSPSAFTSRSPADTALYPPDVWRASYRRVISDAAQKKEERRAESERKAAAKRSRNEAKDCAGDDNGGGRSGRKAPGGDSGAGRGESRRGGGGRRAPPRGRAGALASDGDDAVPPRKKPRSKRT